MARHRQIHVMMPYFMPVPIRLKWLPIGQLEGGHVVDARFGSRMDETIDSVAIWNTPGISVAEILSGLAVARRMRTPAGCATAK